MALTHLGYNIRLTPGSGTATLDSSTIAMGGANAVDVLINTTESNVATSFQIEIWTTHSPTGLPRFQFSKPGDNAKDVGVKGIKVNGIAAPYVVIRFVAVGTGGGQTILFDASVNTALL